MNRRTFSKSLSLSLVVACAAACSVLSDGKQSVSLTQVDELVSAIERVHVESELSRERMREGITALHALVSPDIEDPIVLYADFAEAIKNSETRARALRNAIQPMKNAAGPFFSKWSSDLESFSSVQMRQRSETRYNATRARYDAIVAAVDPALTTYDAFNVGLHDHALFLGHDLNPSSIAEVEDAVRALTELAAKLDGQFAKVLEASRAYVQAAGLPMQAEVAPVKDQR